jgi:hypothetical protein
MSDVLGGVVLIWGVYMLGGMAGGCSKAPHDREMRARNRADNPMF